MKLICYCLDNKSILSFSARMKTYIAGRKPLAAALHRQVEKFSAGGEGQRRLAGNTAGHCDGTTDDLRRWKNDLWSWATDGNPRAENKSLGRRRHTSTSLLTQSSSLLLHDKVPEQSHEHTYCSVMSPTVSQKLFTKIVFELNKR